MSTADDVLDQIDTTLGDQAVSDDAMRWAPDLPEKPRPVRGFSPRDILIRRLVDRHGLTRMTARHAVIAVEEGRTSDRTELVQAEACAVMAETMQQIREAFRPMAESMIEAFKQLVQAFERLGVTAEAGSAPGRRRDRPAWQSPYGPPRRRR